MRIFNADGGEPEMCGNGIRCLGKFLYDSGIVPKSHMTIETLAGVLSLDLCVEGGVARALTVDMGIPRMRPGEIPRRRSPPTKSPSNWTGGPCASSACPWAIPTR